MRAASSQFIEALNKRDVRLATLWRLAKTDGTYLLFTDHDADITIGPGWHGAGTYEAKTGFKMSSIMRASGSSSQGCTITSTLRGEDALLNEPDIRAGVYDSAECEVLVVHWDHPEYGPVSMFTGLVGETKVTNEGSIDLTIERLAAGRQIILERYSVTCRASFGDERCKVPLEPLKITFTVTDEGDGRQTFSSDDAAKDDNGVNDNYWQYGTLVFDTGLNAGVATKVMSSTLDGTITLFAAMPHAIQAGDSGRMWPGCDLQFGSGCVRWNNRVNFRGEPGYQVIQPPPATDGGGTAPPGSDGHWQPFFMPDTALPGHGFFWGRQAYSWSSNGVPTLPIPADNGGYCNSVGGGGFPMCQGPVSVNHGQDPYANPGGTPDPVR